MASPILDPSAPMRCDHDPRNAPVVTFLAESFSTSDVAHRLNARMSGPDVRIESVGTYGSAVARSLSYMTGTAEPTEAIERVVLCSPESAPYVSASTKLLVADPREAFMRFLLVVRPDWMRTVALQAEQLSVSPGAYEAHRSALIEDGTVIGSGVLIEPHAVVREGSIIAENTIVAAGSLIGAHGPATHKCSDGTILSWARIHFGTLQIGRNCEIGCHAVVLKAMLGRTRISDNVILGNMVHIGHGADVGTRVWMAARVTVCGHASIEHDVAIGAGATIRDNIRIGARAAVAMGSVVVGPVGEGVSVLGVPAKETRKTFQGGPTRA